MKSDLEILHGCVLSRPLHVRSFWDILKLHFYFMNFFPFSAQGMISNMYPGNKFIWHHWVGPFRPQKTVPLYEYYRRISHYNY